MSVAAEPATPVRRLVPFAYVETARGQRVRFGRIDVSQSTVVLAAAIPIGIGGGFGAVGFRKLIDLVQWLAGGLLGGHLVPYLGPAAVIVPLVLGGVLVSLIVAYFAPEAKGHGVPEVMAAVALHGGVIRPRVILVKSLASALTIGCGGSCGREGPIVQIGSTIGSLLGQWLGAPAAILRTLVACGAAAGISATFNAPIGGVFFASEVILGEFAPRAFAAIVVASVVSAVIGRAYLGNRPSFDASAFTLVSPRELWLYALLGVICALWAAAFVRILYWFEDRFDDVTIPVWAKAALGFGAVGVIGTMFPQVLGVGYDRMQQVFYGHVPAWHGFVLSWMKILATSLTIGGGGSGGVFSPSLFTGAMIGDAFGRIVHTAFPAWTGPAAAYGLVAMAALFAAAAEAPITSIVIVFEMSSDYTIILPLMISTVIATTLGRRLVGGTVYELKLIRRGIDWARARRPGDLRLMRVADVVRVPTLVAHPDETLDAVAARLRDAQELVLPVVEGRRLAGIVTAADLAAALAAGEGRRQIRALVEPPAATLTPAATLEHAAMLMADPAIPLLPVLGPDGESLLGVVTRRDVLNAYRSSVDALERASAIRSSR